VVRCLINGKFARVAEDTFVSMAMQMQQGIDHFAVETLLLATALASASVSVSSGVGWGFY